MKILFITYCNPSFIKTGDCIYTINILSCLKTIGAEIHFLSYSTVELDSENNGLLNDICKKITYVPFKSKSKIRLLLSIYPGLIKSRKTRKINQVANDILLNNDFDFVVVNHFKMSFIIEDLVRNKFKTVFISHNVENTLSKSLYKFTFNPIKRFLYFQDYLKVVFFEKKYLNQFDILTGISDLDVKYFADNFKEKETVFLPTLVSQTRLMKDNHKISNKIILCGSFYWEPKKENLIRLLTAKNFHRYFDENIEILIVGNAPPKLVKKVNKTYKGVTMTGFVNETIDYYKEAKLALVPEKLGGGFKLKIAEAVSFNLPIVALVESITDLEMVDGTHYISASSFEEMIENSIKLIHNSTKMDLIASNAKKLFEQKYSINAIQDSLLNIFKN